MAARPRARCAAPVPPQATTVEEPWDRLPQCHARPDSRSIVDRMDKAGYRDGPYLWSGCLCRPARCPDRAGPASSFEQTPEGIAALAAFCWEHGAGLVAMEATGGYKRLAFGLLWADSMPVAVVNPRAVRRFAEAMGFLEKTDRIDAGIIAWFATV
jgi:Transposase